ncbi:MAG: hypothetical protein AB7T27_10745 [Kiritimatiellia bacterium]
MAVNFLLAFLALLAGLSAAVAAAVIFMKHGDGLTRMPVFSGVLHLAIVAGIILWAARCELRSSGQLWLWSLILITATVKITLVFLCRNYLQTGDRATFIRFVDALAAGGLGPDNLASLTAFFDYRAWLSRAFPVALVIRWLFGSQHVLFYQLSNVLLSALSVFLFHGLASKLLSPARVHAACVIYALFPLRLFYVLEYTHQFQVEFFVLASTLLIVQLMSGEGAGGRQWIRAVLLGIVLFLLRLQIGWDVLVLVALLAAFAFHLMDPVSRGRRKQLAGLLCTIFVVYWTASAPFDKWAAQQAFPTSGVPGFMARGWSIEALGEYDGLPEQLELAAPPEDKAQTMYAYILSQIYYHPRDVVLKLLPAKMAKYFLVGYATDMDKTFAQSGMPVLGSVFRGMRLFFAPAFLLCVFLGCAGLVRHKARPAAWQPVALLPVIACGVFVLFGETSPKYSFYVHTHMTLIAVSAAGLRSRTSESVIGIRRTLAIMAVTATGIACLYFLLVWALAGAVRVMAPSRVFKNMSGASAARPLFAREVVLSTDPLRAADATDRISWEAVMTVPHKTVLYLWPAGDGPETPDAECRISVNGREIFQAPLREIEGVRRVDWRSDTEEGLQSVELILRRPLTSEEAAVDGSPGIQWGYIHSIPEVREAVLK